MCLNKIDQHLIVLLTTGANYVMMGMAAMLHSPRIPRSLVIPICTMLDSSHRPFAMGLCVAAFRPLLHHLIHL